MMVLKSSNNNFSLIQLSGICTILWCISIGWSTAFSNIMMAFTSILIFISIFYFKKNILLKDVLLFPTSILFVLLALSIFWSESWIYGFSKLKSNLPFILFPVTLFFWLTNDIQIIWKGIKFLIYSLLIAFIITIIWNIVPEEIAMNFSNSFPDILKPYHHYNRSQFGWYVPFMERVHFSNLLVYSGLALFFVYTIEKKVFQLLISVLLLSAPFIIGARASMIGVVCCIPIFIFSIFNLVNIRKGKTIFFIACIVFGIISYFTYPNVQSRIQQTKYELEAIQKNELADKNYEHFTTYTRFAAWSVAWNLFVDQPIIGDGIGDHLYHYDQKYQTDYSDLPICYHSQWLYFLGIFGIIGMLIFIISYIYFATKTSSSLSYLYLLAFTIYTSIIWIFDTGLLQKKEMMAFVLFLSFTECLRIRSISST